MKNLIGCLTISFALISCSNNQHLKPDSNKKLVEKYFQYFNQHQWDKMAAMYADTTLFKDPSLGPGTVKQSRLQIIEKYSGLHSAFPDISDSVINIYPSGDTHIVVEFLSKGTAADSTGFQLPICTIFTIQAGLITKDFTYYDNFEEK